VCSGTSDGRTFSNDPIPSFVPIADTERLRRAWIDQAPDPIAEPFGSHAMRWRLTAPLRRLARTLGRRGRQEGATNTR
jgi:hypothetical protein